MLPVEARPVGFEMAAAEAAGFCRALGSPSSLLLTFPLRAGVAGCGSAEEPSFGPGCEQPESESSVAELRSGQGPSRGC